MNLKELDEIPPWEWPENASSLILGTLKDRKASQEERLLAADMAGEEVVLSEEVGDSLLEIVKSSDEPEDLRSTAAISLGPGLELAEIQDYDDPDDLPPFSKALVEKIQDTFHQLHNDGSAPKNVRRAVLEASVRKSEEWHPDAVRRAYDSGSPDWQLTAVFCMRFMDGFEKEILESLTSKNADIQRNAVEAAGSMEIDAAWPHIKKLITSRKTEKSLLLSAIEAASALRPEETEIYDHLVDSYDEDVSEAALDAISLADIKASMRFEQSANGDAGDDEDAFDEDEDDFEDFDDEEDFEEDEEEEDEDDFEDLDEDDEFEDDEDDEE